MSNTANPSPCPLCTHERTASFHRDARREYFRCGVCGLVFVPAEYFLSAAEEKAVYDQHENDPADAGYRKFLSRVYEPLVRKLAPGMRGLDFGSGPGPTLSVMLTEAGYPTEIYDPFYASRPEVWQRAYDFVTSSEVVEHLHAPREELERLWSVLKPGGWLAIMTKRVRDAAAFERWHYKNDPTHVIFFAEETFVWLADHWRAELEIAGPDVVLLQKPDQATFLLQAPSL